MPQNLTDDKSTSVQVMVIIITWAKVDQFQCRSMSSPSHNELMEHINAAL